MKLLIIFVKIGLTMNYQIQLWFQMVRECRIALAVLGRTKTIYIVCVPGYTGVYLWLVVFTMYEFKNISYDTYFLEFLLINVCKMCVVLQSFFIVLGLS